ncbi:ASCH domain-containing protein [Azospirillum doebereinerae]|uniref:ASCH domain-containing protein n=1 Tax=Azospirillum doebereinerae TaxID=92933 RepID=UPI001EE5E903|nr:ASCH domain-containing protein [Azospirillum doebereinerae]MCG5240074.1 ASCH domain-containing protein [Azospirillum doebereinerae]
MEIPAKALSIRAPWWWFILHGGKDYENRDWWTSYAGPVLIHASKWWGTADALCDMHDFSPLAERYGAPRVKMEMVRPHGGCIVGMVEITDCVTSADSPWFFGNYGFKLANSVAFAEPIPCKGMLGFFKVPPDVMERVRVQAGKVRS